MMENNDGTKHVVRLKSRIYSAKTRGNWSNSKRLLVKSIYI